MGVHRELAALRSYANQLRDEDTRVARPQALLAEVEQLWVRFSAETSFLRPEILTLDAAQVASFLAAEPKLAPYRPFLDDVLRRKPHTLTPAEERIVARTGDLAGAADAFYSVFTNADLPYPEVTLSTGEKVRLDAAAYTKYRGAPARADRERVFDAFWTTYGQFTRSLGTSLYQQVRAHVFYKDVYKFDSSLEASLFDYAIPPGVYHQLLADVRANLGTLHRYLRLRKRILGVDQLRYSDIYAPLVGQADLSYTPEQAMGLVVKAAAPLGDAYVATLRRSFTERWIDFLPSTGKRSGAYSTAVYGVHPYQLQNFMGKYDDVSTLAHESGHSMHSYLSDTNQPYATHDYSLFVAEVASTLNENLLFHSMLEGANDDETRLFLLGSYLDGLRGTLFRQTQFAEFELKIHDMVERGEALTGEALTRMYLDLTRQYYGHAQGVCDVPDKYGVEWAYIPHFYWNFYVYQYATSVVAATSIANGIRDEARGGDPASTKNRDAYLKMLSSGSSKYPIDLLRDAGVDMTTSRPFDAAIREMNDVMDRIERILDRRAKP
jgi:oligoendopeptidase F